MPELPEVETVRRELQPRVRGRQVLEAGSHPSAKFTPAVDAIDASILEAARRGKFLLLPLSDNRELVIHLGMTGKLSFTDAVPEPESGDTSDAYLRAWWRLSATDSAPEQTLRFDDVRRFGRIRVVPSGDYSSIPTLAAAGPEPWDSILTPKLFHSLIKKSSRAIKTQLLSQRPIAGVGNIYADEALWAARINPNSTRVGLERAGVLLDELRNVLEQGIENGGTTLRDYRNVDGGTGENQHTLVAYGRGGEPCLRCDEILVSDVIDARTTVWCPHCQAR